MVVADAEACGRAKMTEVGTAAVAKVDGDCSVW